MYNQFEHFICVVLGSHCATVKWVEDGASTQFPSPTVVSLPLRMTAQHQASDQSTSTLTLRLTFSGSKLKLDITNLNNDSTKQQINQP